MRGVSTVRSARVLSAAFAIAACSSSSPDATPKDAAPGPACSAAPAEATGEATYYDATGAGNCSFEASPDDLMVAAINGTDYGVASWCGACVTVTGPDGEVTVRVVDKCPGCAKGDLDLSRQAFEKIAPLSAGRVPVRWRLAACDVDGGLAYHFKDGSSQYWSAIQVRNHRYPIAKLEAKSGDGAYETIDRVDYNYFVAPESQIGAGPFTFRVTDTRGHVVEDAGIELGDDVERTGKAQFPVCPAS